jgi:hypothetical protein
VVMLAPRTPESNLHFTFLRLEASLSYLVIQFAIV